MRLSDADQHHFAALITTLLSSQALDTPERLYDRIAEPLRKLFRGYGTILLHAGSSETTAVSADLPTAAKRMGSLIAGSRGSIVFGEPPVDAALNVMRQNGAGIWTTDAAARLVGPSFRTTRVYTEGLNASGLVSAAWFMVPGEVREAFLGILYTGPASDALGPDQYAVLRLLLPAVQSSLAILWRAEAAALSWYHMLDCLPEGFVVLDGKRGSVLHRSANLEVMLADDPEREVLERALEDCARRMRRYSDLPGIESVTLAAPAQRVATCSASYRVFGRAIAAPLVQGRQILIVVERTGLRLPAVAELTERFLLTRREAEVAVGLARGFSDAALAAEMGLSNHTVRHHAEQVFLKVGVHSRKALALRLLAGSEGDGARRRHD